MEKILILKSFNRHLNSAIHCKSRSEAGPWVSIHTGTVGRLDEQRGSGHFGGYKFRQEGLIRMVVGARENV